MHAFNGWIVQYVNYTSLKLLKNSDSGLHSYLMNQNQRQKAKTILKDHPHDPKWSLSETFVRHCQIERNPNHKLQKLAKRKQSLRSTSQWLTACKSIWKLSKLVMFSIFLNLIFSQHYLSITFAKEKIKNIIIIV